MTYGNLEAFTDAYIDCALWSSTYGENDESPMDDGEHELAEETLQTMRKDCERFYLANEDHIDSDYYTGSGSSAVAMAGHDFWLTRCGHGAGFWDGDWKEPHAKSLTDAARTFGAVDLYVGDDGLIYAA